MLVSSLSFSQSKHQTKRRSDCSHVWLLQVLLQPSLSKGMPFHNGFLYKLGWGPREDCFLFSLWNFCPKILLRSIADFTLQYIIAREAFCVQLLCGRSEKSDNLDYSSWFELLLTGLCSLRPLKVLWSLFLTFAFLVRFCLKAAFLKGLLGMKSSSGFLSKSKSFGLA